MPARLSDGIEKVDRGHIAFAAAADHLATVDNSLGATLGVVTYVVGGKVQHRRTLPMSLRFRSVFRRLGFGNHHTSKTLSATTVDPRLMSGDQQQRQRRPVIVEVGHHRLQTNQPRAHSVVKDGSNRITGIGTAQPKAFDQRPVARRDLRGHRCVTRGLEVMHTRPDAADPDCQTYDTRKPLTNTSFQIQRLLLIDARHRDVPLRRNWSLKAGRMVRHPTSNPLPRDRSRGAFSWWATTGSKNAAGTNPAAVRGASCARGDVVASR